METEEDNRVMYLCDGEVADCRKTTCYRNPDRRESSPMCFFTSHLENAVNFIKTGHGYREISGFSEDWNVSEKETAGITAAIDEMLRKKRDKLAQEIND